MMITEKDDFIRFMKEMLVSLNYENVEVADRSDYDIKAVRDGKKCCFKCRYDIDAISEKKIKEFIDTTKGLDFDLIYFVTNSSFASSAKKLGENSGIILWDRNTVDRMYISVKEKIDTTVVENKKSYKGLFVALFIIILLAAAAAVYYFFFR